MPPTPQWAQYMMWGMLVLIIILAVLVFFHMKGAPIPLDEEVDKDDEHETPRTLEDLAEHLGKKKDPYN